MRHKPSGAIILLWLSLGMFFLLTFCKSPTNSGLPQDPGGGDNSGSGSSFASNVQPLYNAKCTICHSGTAATAGLNLSSGNAYANTVNVDSQQDRTKKLILPSDADNSYIVIKVEGRQTVGDRMPAGTGDLSANEIQTLKTWTNEGAQNN